MTENVTVDCSTDVVSVTPLSADDQAALDQRVSDGTTAAQQDATAQSNAATVRQKALAALTTNSNYLAITSPTNAQVAAQVKALTKECSGLIRLLLSQLDTTSGT